MNNFITLRLPRFLQGLFGSKTATSGCELSGRVLEKTAGNLNREIISVKKRDYKYLITRKKVAKMIVSHPEQNLLKDHDINTTRRWVYAILLGFCFPLLCSVIDVLVSSDAIGILLNKLPWASSLTNFSNGDSDNYHTRLQDMLTWLTYGYAIVFVFLEILYGLWLSVAVKLPSKNLLRITASVFYYIVKLLPIFVIPILSFYVYKAENNPSQMVMFYSLAGLSVILHGTMVLFSKKIVDCWIFILLRINYSGLKHFLRRLERKLLQPQILLLQRYNNFVYRVNQHYARYATIDNNPYLNLTDSEMREIAVVYGQSAFEVPLPSNYSRRHNRNLMSNGLWHFADFHGLYNESAPFFNSPETPVPVAEESGITPIIEPEPDVRPESTEQMNEEKTFDPFTNESNNII